MHTVRFSHYFNASIFASWAAKKLCADIKLAPVADGVDVTLPRPLTAWQACEFLNTIHDNSLAMQYLVVFGQDARLTISSPLLCWKDPASGLIWDAARVLQSNSTRPYPEQVQERMNALGYGSHCDWRLPTLAELRTIGPHNCQFLRLISQLDLIKYRVAAANGGDIYSIGPRELNVWSSEHWLDWDDCRGLNLLTQNEVSQTYQTPGGYQEAAHTIMVCGPHENPPQPH